VSDTSRQGLVDLLTRIGDDKIVLQGLTQGEYPCLRGARLLKGGFTEIRFGTEAITPTELMNGEGRVGLVLWLQPADVALAREDWAAENPKAAKG
jgi:hypothetical protein